MIATVTQFECQSLLRSVQTWIIAGVMAVLFAFLFLQALETFLEVQPTLALQDHPTGVSGFLSVRYLAPLVMIFALVAPLLAMKSFSDEYRQHTLALWQSSPVSNTALVVGKFLGVYCVVVLLILIACVMPLLLRFFVPLDLGVLSSSTLGLLLATSSFVAIGLFFSSLTKHAILAVAASVILLVVLWLIGSSTNLSMLKPFAIPTHVAGFFQGFISSADVLYFVIITVLFIALTIVRLDALRQSGV
jgi:ABC-2 type transport system permease protein